MVTCNICAGPVKLEDEGGIQGYIGILPFALGVWCHAGMTDMVQSTCETCQLNEEELWLMYLHILLLRL